MAKKSLDRVKAQPQEAVEEATEQLLNQDPDNTPEDTEQTKELKTQRVTFVVKPSVWKTYQELCKLKGLKPSLFISERFTEWVMIQAEDNKEFLDKQRQNEKEARG